MIYFGDTSPWNGPVRIVFNLAVIAFQVGVLVAIFLPRSRDFRRGWKSMLVWVLSWVVVGCGIGALVDGFLVPVGAWLVLRQVLIGWRQLDPTGPDGQADAAAAWHWARARATPSKQADPSQDVGRCAAAQNAHT